MTRILRAAALALAVAAAPIAATGTAHADPGICIDHVMENGYEATEAVLRACKIAKTGRAVDVSRCRRILTGEGVTPDVARHACRIASQPER